MITDEFIPMLGARGLDVSRVALLGYSMGGFGALYLADRMGASRVAAVVAESPALWHTYARSARGAYDSAADFAACTPFGRQARLDGVGVLVDCGLGDGFYPVAKSYVEGFPAGRTPAGGFTAGGHNDAYWRRMAPAQLRFVAEHLPR